MNSKINQLNKRVAKLEGVSGDEPIVFQVHHTNGLTGEKTLGNRYVYIRGDDGKMQTIMIKPGEPGHPDTIDESDK